MDHPKALIKQTKKYGQAVYAGQTIRKGETIAVFDGLCYDNDFEDWTDDLYNHTIQFAKSDWRDSAGLARLINHSCDPNCGIKKYFRIVALRTIPKGEEITWDYEMTEKNKHWKMKCRCGSKDCRKVIGNFSRMPKKVRDKYKGYISDWLLGKPIPAAQFKKLKFAKS